MSLVQRVGFYVNAVNHVFPPTKEMTQKILSVQFVTEKMIVVAPYMVSFLTFQCVLIKTRQIIQLLMRRTAKREIQCLHLKIAKA